ncbi:MAG: choice-of-anchor E domain-containing protein [Phycisphaeraceae bacterium]|nr:choice-of-anchor E domain-containing protein [Phycisphaeraceae bacterium]
MSGRTLRASVLALLSVLVVAGVAQAAVISYSDTIALQRTNFNENLSVSQFDPSLGVLTQVKLTFTGDLLAQAGYEYIDVGPSYVGIIDYSITQDLEITQGAETYLTLSNNVVDALDVPALLSFDGVLDFAGASGYTDPGVAQGDIQVYVLTNPGDLAPFIGLGTTDYYVAAALASSSISGPNGLVAMTSSYAGASLTVEYTYIPEPATLGLLALGGLALIRRR